MTNATMTMMALYAVKTNEAKEPTLPEPEFKPFRFPRKDAVRGAELAAANTAREPRTLGELGVPGPLAREIEAALRGLGLTRGDRVKGYTFRTADGTRYALKTTAAPAREAGDLAA